MEQIGFRIGDKVEIYEDKEAITIRADKRAAESEALIMKSQIKKSTSDTRHDLHRLIEIRDALSEVILEVSQRLDVLVVEYTKKSRSGKQEGST